MSSLLSSSACLPVADLLVDYADQLLPPDQADQVAAHLTHCVACQQQVAQLRELSVLLETIEPVVPTPALRSRFLQQLEQEKASLAAAAPAPDPVPAARIRPMWTNEAARWTMRIAAGVALLVLGMLLGQRQPLIEPPTVTSSSPGTNNQALQLTSALSGEGAQRLSASDRIQLVSTVSEAADATGDPIVQALINTLNFDPNTNVRLAAANALYRLRADPRVGEAFTQSLTIQTDPNVQILLIELLVNMRERRATTQLEQLARKPDALLIVRQQAEYGLGTLL